MRAVVLIVRLANIALEAGSDLSTHAHTITHFASRHLITNPNCLTNDLVAYANWQRSLAPASIDSVYVGATDTASINLDVNVTILEWFYIELPEKSLSIDKAINLGAIIYLFLLEVAPFVLRIDHKPFELIWVRHFEDSEAQCT